MSLSLDVARCPGKQTLRGALAGICVACERRTSAGDRTPTIEPPALILRAVWVCAQRIVPAGS
jgi:hypothetical protein